MKVEVDKEECVSCGACIDICPKVFYWNDDEKADVILVTGEVPAELRDETHEAVDSCPTNAIKEF